MGIKDLTPEGMLECYREMLRIRLVELKVMDLFKKGEIPGFIHVCLGQEAAPVAVCKQLHVGDWVVSTHRGHGHALAKGLDLKAFFAELMGKKDGSCGGRGGSMHLADRKVGLFMANGIVGAGIPLAAGLALAAKCKRTGQVSVCFFGEGASNEGVFYETLNIAALMKLPVVFVCENNQWAQFTKSERVTISPVTKRAEAMGVPSTGVRNKFEEIWEKANEAISAARNGLGPRLLEVSCWRWEGHYVGDPQKYREKEDLERAREEDCVKDYEEVLRERGLLDDSLLDAMTKDLEEEIGEAVEHARSGPIAAPESLLEEVFVG